MPYKDKDKRLEYDRTWKRKNTTSLDRRRSKLKMKYGISLEEYDRVFEEQGGRCAICGETSDSYLVVDHDHLTKEIRGLLCNFCNIGLGIFKDNIDLFKKVIEYLSRRRIMDIMSVCLTEEEGSIPFGGTTK